MSYSSRIIFTIQRNMFIQFLTSSIGGGIGVLTPYELMSGLISER